MLNSVSCGLDMLHQNSVYLNGRKHSFCVQGIPYYDIILEKTLMLLVLEVNK